MNEYAIALREILEAVSFLIYELSSTNRTLMQMLELQAMQRSYSQGIVDELRTLNHAIGRLEDSLLAR